MNILILGSGGREHALAWKIAQSSQCDHLYIAPGNGGTNSPGHNVPVKIDEFDEIKEFVLENDVHMVIVGPEDPLVQGVHDYFLSDDELAGIPVIGPQKNGAHLEGSKAFAKEFMRKYRIPTAKSATFDIESLDKGLIYLQTLSVPYVLKADGLAAGKGVIISDSIEEAQFELKAMIADAKFGAASSKVVIEEFMQGIEFSVFVITDGLSYKILPSAKDYKRWGEGDTGLNTGGMGAISPVPFLDQELMNKVEKRIIAPTMDGLQHMDINYKGFLYFGLMNVDGDPYVIEYNARMGDPETQVVLPRLKNDILELFQHVANQTLSECEIEIDDRASATVVIASGGYPKKYEKGKVITGLDNVKDSIVFHAGTQIDKNDKVVTSGGRVLAVTSFADKTDDSGSDEAIYNQLASALETCYKNCEVIDFEGKYFRKDIGFDLVKRPIES